LPVLVLGALLASTLIGAFQASQQHATEAEQRFRELAARERERIEQRFEAIVERTGSVAALAAAAPRWDETVWSRYFKYGVLGRHPEPALLGMQWAAAGAPPGAKAGTLFEQRFAQIRVDAPARWADLDAVRALGTPDQPALSEPLEAIRRDGAASHLNALVVAAPTRTGEPGVLVALLDMAALLDPPQPEANPSGVAVSLTAGAATVSSQAAGATAVLRRHTEVLRLGQREFTFNVTSTPELERRLASDTPRMVLLVGLVSCTLLAGLIWLLTRLRAQAEALAAQMTRKLTDQTRFTEDLIEHNPNPIFRKDTAGRFVSVNRAWEEFSGHSRAAVMGAGYEAVMPPEDARRSEEQDAALLASREERATIETPFCGAGGRTFETIIAKQAVRSADGRPEGLIGTITDVTQIKALERALDQQREQQNLVIRSSQQGIWDALDDPATRPYFSERFKEILGYTHDDFPATFDWREVLHPEDAEGFKREMTRLFKRESELFDAEARVRCRDGNYVWVRARGIAQYGPDGRATRFTGSITDVSDRKRAQLELVEANIKVTEAARAKEAFLATMSHEMRTPLNGVLGMTSLLAETALDDEQREHIRLIRASGDTLLRIIDDILDYSKIESGHMTLEALSVELVPLIEEAFEMVAEKAREKRLALLVDFDDTVPYYVVGDATRLRQILLNLLANAIKFTEHGHIAVLVSARTTMDGRLRLEFRVEDTGIGIPADRLDRLFQPFTQVDASTTRKFGGTGLGLAICKRLVNLMGGDIRVESREGQGSTFIFTVVTEAARGARKAYMQRRVAEFAGVRLLAIDANPRRRQIQKKRYRDWGFDALVCDATEGAWLLEQHADFDIVLTDTVANDAAGLAVARALEQNDAARGAAERPSAVVILASTMSRAELAALGEVPALRHDFFVMRPVGRSRMFELFLRASLGQRTFDFAARPFTRVPVSELPPKRTRLREGRTGAGAAQATAARTQRPHALRLLIAEDNDVNQRVITGMVRNLGHEFVLVADGLAAFEAARAGRFDAILLDVQMPVIDGVEAMKRIREALGDKACPPLIAMTAHALPGDREHYLALGMDHYLAKPIRSAALAEVLEKALHREAANTAVANVPDPIDALRVLDVEQLQDLRGLPAAPGETVDDGANGLIELFRTQTRDRLGIMDARHDLGDWAGLAETAHSLRGAAASIGFPRVAALCKDLEAIARTLAGQRGKHAAVADASPRQAMALIAHLKVRVEEANRALDKWLATQPA
jgi:PAS domain S-box-containing protein